MRDEPTPTEFESIDAIAAQLQSFRDNPKEQDLFRELKRALRKDSRSAELAEVYELRAAVEPNQQEALRQWFDAANLRLDLGDTNVAIDNFRNVLALDPTHEKSSRVCCEQLIADERYAEAADLIESEISALEAVVGDTPSAATRRLAARYRVLAALWQDQLGRLDKALQGWQRSFQLEPSKTEALEQSRVIYTSLGDEDMVLALYETELQLIGQSGDRARRAEIELALGGLKRRRADTQGAAEHLESALELNPDSLDARESLAEVLSSLEDSSQHLRASELFVDLGQRRMQTEDQEGAISYLRRALGVNPSSQQGTDNLESVLSAARRWKELDRLYQQQLSLATSPEDQAPLLAKRAELCEEHLDDKPGLKECLRQLSAMHPPGNDFQKRLRVLLEADDEGEEIVRLLEAEIATKAADDPQLVTLLLDLANTHRSQMGDRDRAAETLHRILGYDPLNAEALARYSEHFRERRDWRGLTDLSEYTIDQLRERQAPVAELIERLESVAELCELRLGDIDRAILTWRRIEELEGHTPKTSDAMQRLMSRAKMWESLVGVLEQEAQQATTPDERAKTLRRIAQVYRERQVNPRRAISLYEEVLGMFPDDDATLKALTELYDREGDDAGLAHTIRRQLDLAARRLDASGSRPGTEREWPVAKRTERLTALRRVASLYETQLADVEGVVYACSGVLELLPGDREALDRMERVLEKAGDKQRLEQTLEYHAACSTAPVERSKLLRRMARLAEDRGDEVVAMDRWEQVVGSAPNDAEALEQLAGLYERHQRHTELAEVLDRALMNAELPKTGSAAAAHMSAQLKRLARVLDNELKDGPRATRVWQRLLKISERDRDSLSALCRLHEGARQWRELAETLERQVPVYAADDPEQAAIFALKRADLLEERLGSPELATEALEHLIAHVSPRNLEAHRKLRRLYETRGSFEASIRIAEREMVLTEDPNAKISRGLEIGLLCRDRINDPKRALQAYERVLKLAPEHEEALSAAADLYAKVGRWREHVSLLERRVDTSADVQEKRALMLRIATVTAEELADHRSAFQWYGRAHELSPDATTMGELRRAAESYGLWRELANVYEGDREQLRADGAISDPQSFVQLSKDIAQIAESRLRDPQRAIDALYAALEVAPLDQHLMIDAERIAQESNRKPIWDRLLQCFDLPMAVAVGEERVQLYRRRAQLREEHARDPEGALEDLLVAFSWASKRSALRDALYEFGERNRSHWQRILTVETALAERATTNDERIAILRRKAEAYEKRATDPVRAFRTHMSAFILVPEDEETLSNVWRLARHIGHYTDSQRSPAAELPGAHIEALAEAKPVSVPSRKRPHIAATKPRREATQELSISDLVDDEDQATITDATVDEAVDLGSAMIGNQSPVGDSTQELDISELLDSDGRAPVHDPTMELRTEDLIEALGRKRAAAPPEPPKATGQRKPGQGPPPPPTKRPQIRPMPGVAQVEVATSKSGRVTIDTTAKADARQTLPSSPQRAYSSPWSELASVYCKLPAETKAGRLRWHYRAAEVWETGAKEITRAFDVLATALRAAPNSTETRDRLFQIASTHNEWDRLAQLYDRAADTAGSAEAAAELLMQVATIRATQGRPRETESLYRRVLGMRPGDINARQELEQLYRSEERWVDLAAQLEERTDPRLGSAAPIAERPALLRELASLYSEKLSRPHDAIDTLERLLEIEPENTDLLAEVAKSYETIGKWSKVIQTLTRLCDLADGEESAREALGQIGRIYEEQLELPDRAIVAYSRLLGEWHRDEQAFNALDRLYQQYARWEDLDGILRQRASIVSEPEVRAALLHRRAKIMLEWLGAPDDAAAALRHARTIDPDNRELADDLIEALIKAGRHREAASVLEGRIARLRDAKEEIRAAEGEIAALLIRLGALRGDSLSDPIGAKQVLEEALELVPSHPTALATLARLTSAEQDPCAHAAARIREAEALDDVDAKIEALLDAGQSFRDGHDHASARAAFEEILSLRPYHAESTWALSALVEEGGDVDGAIKLLSARLQAASLESDERAEVLTQLAALSRQAGVESAAEQRLKEALEHKPEHMPAILSLADLLSHSERWQDLEEFLSDVLPRVSDDEAATRAELMRRLASAYDGVERHDDAYQTLIGADRLHRGNLLIKLELGENRYRARRWREAALHLSALAERDDARSHPSKVASGLYHAALAEIRSLRPEKAEALYRAALKLKGNYGPALQALAEIEMERGNTEKASDLLTKQAVATESPKERLRLFEALGDMAMEQIHDEQRARVCYEAALRAAEPLDSEHIPLLQKLLARQVAARDRAECGRICELLASFTQDAAERCERHTEAAQHFIDAELPLEARDAADRAVNASPYDLVACDMASELAMEVGDHEATAAMLGRLLNQRDATSEDSDAKDLALLWTRLADARQGRGDTKGAESCYEKALELSPESEGAMNARRALLKAWNGIADKAGTVREFRRTLAANTLIVDDIVSYAHGEFDSGDADGARCALELAAALGYDHTENDVAFLARHTTKVMADDEAFKGSLAPQERSSLLADPLDEPLATICSTLWESAALLWSDVDEALERAGVTEAKRITATGKLRAAAIFTRIARAMSAPATILYTSDAPDAPDVQVVCVSPPIIVFGPRLVDSGDDHEPVSDLELRFMLARAAELARPSRIIAAGQPLEVFERLVSSLWRIFGEAGESGEVSESQHAEDEELRKTLPVRARAQLEDMLSERPQLAGNSAPAQFRAACHRSADRAGLLLCGDVDSALRYAAQQDDQTHLLRMPMQPEYLATRAQLGIGAKKR